MPQADINMSQLGRTFTLIGRNGESYQSPVRGILGGHGANKITAVSTAGGSGHSAFRQEPAEDFRGVTLVRFAHDGFGRTLRHDAAAAGAAFGA